ncbi:mandelate racemase/muconate lactonizing enzyme family protein [Halobaculum sp. D14]|uniref:mandelate racemase/muconate lactonizing enzyme family protein n=1 Tax=Halobaculum sp. D14 TaxID=3421642 RepID=UPI003EB777FB
MTAPAAFRVREFSLPLRSPLGTATGELSSRRVAVVSLVADETEADGPANAGEAGGGAVSGVGEAAPLPPWTEPFGECRDALAAVRDAVGRGDDVDLDALPPAARHAVTLADADAAAKRGGVPLAATVASRAALDGDPAESVPVNATVGDGAVAETVAAAESAVDAGHGCLKCKVGARAVHADVERLRAVRDAVGDDVALRADANGAWSREQAERAVDALADLDFEYVEQPVPAGDHDALAALRGRGVDVAVDETVNAGGAWPEPLGEYADVAVLKPMAQGGLGATASLARHLDGRGVDAVVTTTVDAAVARTGAVHLAAALDGCLDAGFAHGLATGGMLASDVAADPAPVEHGRIAVPDGPGLAGGAFDDVVTGRKN